eukprot:SAG11_NODE_1258_length_5362_cov_16.457534_3_plen_264_part_00
MLPACTVDDSCLETLYPPGTCGSFCNQHTFECYLAEVQDACCDEGGRNCVSGEDIPETCPVGCAIVYPQFLETCAEHLQGTGAVMADFAAFETECLDMDGVELVEYAIMLLERGCVINLGGMADGRRQLTSLTEMVWKRRRLQSFLATHLTSGDETCSWDEIDDFAREVDSVCCGRDGSGCPHNGQPSECSTGCAVTIHQFTTKCSATLAIILKPVRAGVGQRAAARTIVTVVTMHTILLLGRHCTECCRCGAPTGRPIPQNH